MNNRFVLHFRRVLLVAIFLLFILFMITDICNIRFYLSSRLMKFISIFLCLVISIISSSSQSKNDLLLIIGLFLTTIADYLFLILAAYYSLAIAIFSIVQIIYSLRYREGNEFRRILDFCITYILIFVLYRIINRFFEMDYLIAIGMFYFICLSVSIKESYCLYKKDKQQYKHKMIFLAMILFLLCDINLALNYFMLAAKNSSYIFNAIKGIVTISIWLYYLPSQVLLALSGNNDFVNEPKRR